jgi:hypothetical protein
MNGNKSAFPVADTVANGERYEPLNTGLTKLEYFAGIAMQGMLSNGYEFRNYIGEKELVAKLAIEHAKELLKQLEEEK